MHICRPRLSHAFRYIPYSAHLHIVDCKYIYSLNLCLFCQMISYKLLKNMDSFDYLYIDLNGC